MITTLSSAARMVRLLTIALTMCASMGSAGCIRQIRNDIDSTNAELTGPYTVKRVAGGATYVADICVASASEDDLVASQIVHQLLSHGHRAIVVNLYDEHGGDAERVTWTPEKGSEKSRIASDGSVCGGGISRSAAPLR
jgi:hypothetical protein